MRHVACEGEKEEEEKWLSVALFATQCVEKVGLSSDCHNHTHPHGKKKQPQRIAPSKDKDQLTLIAYENKGKRDLWNADAGLIMWNNISVLVGHFERHLWALVPLHPSALQEDNVRFALMGQQSERVEDFPLFFNVNVAMACGTYYSPSAHLPLSLTFGVLSLWCWGHSDEAGGPQAEGRGIHDESTPPTGVSL